jgi:UDP-galactose transporter B1
MLADGFLPDFQAQIKAEYKPQPTEMMEQINKWVAIISLFSMAFSLTALNAFVYTFEHPMFFLHLLAMSFLSCAGQFFVYRMIKQFKQHIVPFIITTRKIFTIVLSIFFYSHKTTNVQMIGVFIVFAAVFFEFGSELRKEERKV